MDFPRYNLRETGIYGLTDEGKAWLTDLMKEACDAIGVAFQTSTKLCIKDPEWGYKEREALVFHFEGSGLTCRSQFLENCPLDTLAITFYHPPQPAIWLDDTAMSREIAVKKIRCAVIRTDPERYLELIMANVVK